MKILLLGATGRTGKLVLKEALKNGYQVHCLARNSQRIEKLDGLTIFEGNAHDANHLRNAMATCDAVISVLNISRRSDFPWARLRTPKNYLSEVMRLLVPLMEEKTIKRVSVCSAWGVSETKKDIPKWFKWFIDNSNIGVAYQDHERQEKILTASHLNWTIVRPVGLTNSRKSTDIKERFDNKSKPSLLISRQSVAKFLVDSLAREDLSRKKVVISKA